MTGRVQGVSYRASTARAARDLGLAGWVRNVNDGSVELEVEGHPDAVAKLLAWCQRGPAGASVASVVVDELAPTDETTFEIRRDADP